MKLVVLSGKGGVGKSSISSSLAVLLSEKYKVVAVDCDVATPNLGLCFGKTEADFNKEEVSTSEVATVIKKKFPGYQSCVDVCEFSAMTLENGLEINPFLCEGCGTCLIACPENAIKIEKVKNGWIGFVEGKFPIVSGQLKMGQSGSGEIVNLVRKKAEQFNYDIMIIDSPAGIGCPVIASVKGSDFVVAVTEPTPSALSDLERVLEVVDHFGIEKGLVINKTNINPGFVEKIEEFAAKKNIRILGRLPYDLDFVNSIVNLQPPVSYQPKFRPLFEGIIREIRKIKKPC